MDDGFNGSGITIGAIAGELEVLDAEGIGAGERLRLDGLIGGVWLFNGGEAVTEGLDGEVATGRELVPVGGVNGTLDWVASEAPELILDNSLA